MTFPFQIYPVNSGGALRGYFLLRELARHFDTVAIVVNSADSIQNAIRTELGSDLTGISVQQLRDEPNPRGLLNRIKGRLQTALNSRSLNVPTNAVILSTSRLLQNVIPQHQPQAVVLTNMESWVCAGMLKRNFPQISRIIDMPNVEHILYSQQLNSEGAAETTDAECKRLKTEESSLHKVCDGLFACSDDDCQILQELNFDQLNTATIPNGVACEQAEFDSNLKKHDNKDLLFCGTLSYPPNIDGLNWFVSEIFPQVLAVHPETRIRIVGRNFRDDRFPGVAQHPSIDVVGEVDSVNSEYLKTGIALCPLRMGSGTRLKILESMSFGNPTVSTAIGCEGIKAIDGESILIRDEAQSFADGVNQLLSSPAEFHAIRNTARQFVEQNYDWKVIGNSAAAQIRDWTAASGKASA